MKNLLKAEFYLLVKQKSKLLVVPLLMLTYFVGVIFSNNVHNDHINAAKQSSVSLIQTVSKQSMADNCVLGLDYDPFSDMLCGKEHHSEEDIDFAKRRLGFNQYFIFDVLSVNASIANEKFDEYFPSRLKMLKSAKIMQESGIENGYYFNEGLFSPEDYVLVDREIQILKEVIDNDYQIQLSDYAINSSNYLRVFLSNGGMIAFIMIIILFNLDFFVDDNNLSVNNVVYTQTYSRFQINLAKILASIIYSVAAIIISLFLGYLIIGVVFGFGSLNYPIVIRSNINSFNLQAINTYVVSTVKNQLFYIGLMTTVLTVTSLAILHLTIVILQNSSAGLFLVYLLLTIKFILKNSISKIFLYYPFAYDNMEAVFRGNYNFIYGIISLLLISVISLFLTMYIGDRIDIKVGD